MRVVNLVNVTSKKAEVVIEKGLLVPSKYGVSIKPKADKNEHTFLPASLNPELLVLCEDMGPGFNHYPLVTVLSAKNTPTALLLAE